MSPKEVLFFKIQATGNDFIILDYNSVDNTFFTEERIRHLCNRNFGIGADGLIALERTKKYPFRFHYYNADGSRADLCGNGCRAAICYALENKWINARDSFEFLADDGIHWARIIKQGYAASILVSHAAEKINLDLFDLPQWITAAYSINTGVPHVILFCENIKDKKIFEIGKYLRFHKHFSPQGTNVNFTEIIRKDSIYVRTYERGVEAETLSCGTGITGAAIIFKELQKLKSNLVKVETAGGKLQISFKKDKVLINGPSKISFKGYFML